MILKVLLHISLDNSILKPDELPFASPKKKKLYFDIEIHTYWETLYFHRFHFVLLFLTSFMKLYLE